MLKILLGELQPDSGQIMRGDVKIGYFDQNRANIDENKSLIQNFCPNGGDHIMVRCRNMHVYGYLKNFLFPKEFLDKLGVIYERQFEAKDIKRFYDFKIGSILIEVDGDYW